MNRAEIRAAIYAKQLKIEEVAKGVFPELEEAVLDGDGNTVHNADGGPLLKSIVALRELNGAEIQMVQKDADSAPGKLLAMSLIVKDTKEQVFGLTEIDSIINTLGNTVLEPLLQQAMKLSGLSQGAVPEAKNA